VYKHSLPVLAIFAICPACTTSNTSSTTVTVNGSVQSGPGLPVSGAKVVLNDNPNHVFTTGADGKFSFINVTPPYSLTLKIGKNLQEIRDLNLTQPRLVSNFVEYSTKISGTVSGVQFPLPEGQSIYVAGKNVIFSALASATDGTFSSTAQWVRGVNIDTELVAVLIKRKSETSATIEDFLRSGKRSNIQLINEISQSGLDISLSTPIQTATTTLSINSGFYSNNIATSLTKFIIDGVSFGFLDGTSLPELTNGSIHKLPVSGLAFQLRGSDISDVRASIETSAVAGGTTTLTLPTAPLFSLITPTSNASNIDLRPTFSWVPVAGAKTTHFSLSGGGTTYHFYLNGDVSSFTLPDFSFLGLSLNKNTLYSWEVQIWTYSDLAPEFFVTSFRYELTKDRISSGMAFNAPSRSFSTAP
jgi:hypothetical protein